MSKKKSLGSSPIGFQSRNSSMQFIPDLGVSKPDSVTKTKKSFPSEVIHEPQKESVTRSEEQKSEKKIVSYNLEVNLISRVKSLANEKGMYYSSLVSAALKSWIADNG